MISSSTMNSCCCFERIERLCLKEIECLRENYELGENCVGLNLRVNELEREGVCV
jgi:hypothetical protein